MEISKVNIFTTTDLRADHHILDVACNTLVITFTERSHRDLEAPGFGTNFITKNGFDVLAIKTNVDRWYENLTEDHICSILEYLERHSRKYSRVFGYGSSMGGYAAIRFSGPLMMSHVCAISPLYDIKSDFDKRWIKDTVEMNNDEMMRPNFISSCP